MRGSLFFRHILLLCCTLVVWAAGHGTDIVMLKRDPSTPTPSSAHFPVTSLQFSSDISEATIEVSKALETSTSVNSLRVENIKANDSDQITGGLFREGDIVGKRNFTGFAMYEDELDAAYLSEFSSTCRTSMTQQIDCHEDTYLLQGQTWKGGLDNDTLSDLICDPLCGASISSWFNEVVRNCNTEKEKALIPRRLGGQLWAGWNETCLKDPESDRYCGDVINDFTVVSHIEDMPNEELCSFCYVRRYEMMQSTSYSVYDKYYQSDLKYINKACGLSISTQIPDPLMVIDDPYKVMDDFCASDTTYTTQPGDTCDTIAARFSVASASLFMGNDNLLDCFSIPKGTRLCIPFSCEETYTLQNGDTCTSIEQDLGIPYSHGATIRKYNPWINYDCSNLHEASNVAYGHVLCAVPQAGRSTILPPRRDYTSPRDADGYAIPEIPPPEGVIVAEETTYRCGKWHVVTSEKMQETCTTVCIQSSIPWDLFLEANPSLDAANCELVDGTAYCVGPTYEWKTVFEEEDEEDEDLIE